MAARGACQRVLKGECLDGRELEACCHARKQGGVSGKIKGWTAAAKAAVTFAALYTIPAKRHALPASVRLEPSY